VDGHTSAAPFRAVPCRRGHMDRRNDDSSGYPIRLDVRAVRARGRTIQAWPAGCGLRWVSGWCLLTCAEHVHARPAARPR
jgi:hypothetical protein